MKSGNKTIILWLGLGFSLVLALLIAMVFLLGGIALALGAVTVFFIARSTASPTSSPPFNTMAEKGSAAAASKAAPDKILSKNLSAIIKNGGNGVRSLYGPR